MKKSILVIMVLVLPLCGFSQITAYFFGKTKQEIKAHMSERTKLTLMSDPYPENDTAHVSYKSKDFLITNFYFDEKTKVCNQILITREIEDLPNAIVSFNEESTKIGVNKWISKDFEVETDLVYTPNEKTFSIIYTKL